MSEQIERGSPPSTYAILALLEGEEGAFWRVVWGTLQRSAFIAPGLFLVGVRKPAKLVGYSLAASTSITACLIGYYALGFHRGQG